MCATYVCAEVITKLMYGQLFLAHWSILAHIAFAIYTVSGKKVNP